ncbi:hypothetical protein BaRGS_00005893 [Batillaria attramentaria]|uniref:Ig-like domain-containing protein n=1 Tax=Batillaria attramentaria TaxID=370345 RepID=A0ABD0LV91_9CAEN
MVRAVIMSTAGKLAVLIFLVLLHETKGTELDCGPGGEAREGSDHTLTCDGIQDGQPVAWIKTAPVFGDITVASCTDVSSCQSNFTSKYDVTRPSNVSSTLKILDVERDDAPDIGECVVGFDEMTSQVNGRCEMHKVYPRPTCSWYQTLQYVDASKHQIYFRATCDLHSPLPTSPGTYSYKVLITPGLVEPQITYTTTTVVAFPATPTLRNCPQDYVTDADVTSCTCVTTDLGSPQGYLAWYDPSNTIILRNTSLVLTLPFSDVIAENSEATYRCAAVHHTGSPNVSYTPKIAVAPNKPVLSGLKEDADYSVDEFVNAACSANGGKPAITRVILACGERRNQSSSQVGETVVSRLLFKLQGSDKNGLQCACSAANGYFTSENVTVTLKVKGSSTSDSDNGDTKSIDDVGLIVGVLGSVVAALIIGLIAHAKRRTCLGTKGKETHGQTPQEPGNGSADERMYADNEPILENEHLHMIQDHNTTEQIVSPKPTDKHQDSEKPSISNPMTDASRMEREKLDSKGTMYSTSQPAQADTAHAGPGCTEHKRMNPTDEAHRATSGQSSPPETEVTEKNVHPQVQGPDLFKPTASSQQQVTSKNSSSGSSESAVEDPLTADNDTVDNPHSSLGKSQDLNLGESQSPSAKSKNTESAEAGVPAAQNITPSARETSRMSVTQATNETSTKDTSTSSSPADGCHSSVHSSLSSGENSPSSITGSVSSPDGSLSPNPEYKGTETIAGRKEILLKNETCSAPENKHGIAATDKSDKSEDAFTKEDDSESAKAAPSLQLEEQSTDM